MKIILRLVFYFIGIFLLVELNSGTLISDIKGIFTKHPEEIADSTYVVKNIPNDYLQLLNLKGNCCNNDSDNFFFLKTYDSKYRNPISFFIYKKYYYLQIYKLESHFTSPLKGILTENHFDAANYHYGFFLLDEESAIDYSYKKSAPPKLKTITLTLLGENTRIALKNDSVAYYLSSFKNFSIQFNKTELFDIYGETKGNGLFTHQLQPLELMFVKKNESLFLLTMSVYKEDQTEKHAPGMIYDIIKNNKL